MYNNDLKKMFDLTGKTAIITGAGTGLGKGIAFGLASAGAKVVIVDMKEKEAINTAKEIKQKGCNSLSLKINVTDENQVAYMVNNVLEYFGSIDILVNNVGGGGGKGSFLDISFERWKQTFNLTVHSTFLCSQKVAQVMVKQKKGGKIINIASVYGFVGKDVRLYPIENGKESTVAYNASKGAIVTFTRDLATSLAKYNINVNAIAPGMMATEATINLPEKYWDKLLDRIPLHRKGYPEDLQGAAVLLSSKAADYITGHIIVVDGGWIAW